MHRRGSVAGPAAFSCMHCVWGACGRGQTQTLAGAGASLRSVKRLIRWRSRHHGSCVLVHGPTKALRRSGPALSLCAAAPAQRAEKKRLPSSTTPSPESVDALCQAARGWPGSAPEGTVNQPATLQSAAAVQKLCGQGRSTAKLLSGTKVTFTSACDEGDCDRDFLNEFARIVSVARCQCSHASYGPTVQLVMSGRLPAVASIGNRHNLAIRTLNGICCVKCALEPLTIKRLASKARGPRRRVCTRACSAVQFPGPWVDDRHLRCTLFGSTSATAVCF